MPTVVTNSRKNWTVIRAPALSDESGVEFGASKSSERTLLGAAYRRLLYPERFAQEALGHNSKAVHRAYAKRALMKIPSLEDYERQAVSKRMTTA
jgi:hypothetical protein